MNASRTPIPNPYAGHDTYHCFGCDPRNSAGLRLTFAREGQTVVSEWTPRPELEGYPGVVHGGIQATLTDEVGAWYLHAAFGTAGVTKTLSVEYHRPAVTTDAPFLLRAHWADDVGHILAPPEPGSPLPKEATILVTVHGHSGDHFCTARIVYAVFSEAVARRRFSFPGREAFGLR